MMGISNWFKRFRTGEDALDVERAEEKARQAGAPADDLPADAGSIDDDLDESLDNVTRWNQTP
jgi:hypothetical protein